MHTRYTSPVESTQHDTTLSWFHTHTSANIVYRQPTVPTYPCIRHEHPQHAYPRYTHTLTHTQAHTDVLRSRDKDDELVPTTPPLPAFVPTSPTPASSVAEPPPKARTRLTLHTSSHAHFTHTHKHTTHTSFTHSHQTIDSVKLTVRCAFREAEQFVTDELKNPRSELKGIAPDQFVNCTIG